jgi:hypothetical protein
VPQAGWAVQEITYGPWKSAVTNTTPDPLDGEQVAVIPLATGDELAARFALNNAGWIQVSVFLETSPEFDLTQASLSLQLRALQGGPTVPGTVIPGTTTPFTIDDDEWRSYKWYTDVIPVPGTASGPYWVCLVVNQAPTNGSLGVVVERTDRLEHTLTWNPVADRYQERDGLWFDGSWTENEPDPYIRVRQDSGVNQVPLVSSLLVSPNPATVGDTVTFTGTATDGDGPIAINYYRFSYTKDGDPTRVVLDESPIAVVSDPVQAVFQTNLLPQGTYQVYFDVRDDDGTWSVGQLPVLFNNDDPPPIPGTNATEMGDITDECGDDYCLFLAQLLGGDVVDPDGNPTTVKNKYSVVVEDDIPGATDHVWFRVECPDDVDCGSDNIYAENVQSTPDGNRYTVEFDMTELPGPGTYDIIAEAHAMHTGGEPPSSQVFVLASSSAELPVLPAPGWYKLSRFDGQDYVGKVELVWDAEDRLYTFRGRIPHNPTLYYDPCEHNEDYCIIIPYFDANLKTAGGIKMDFEEDYDLQGSVEKAAEAGMGAWLLGVEIFNVPFDVEVIDEGEDAGQYLVSYNGPVIYDYDKTLVDDKKIFSGAVDGVQFDINLTIDFGMEIAFDVCAELDENMHFDPVCLVPELDTWFEFDASLDLYTGVATFGAKGKPQFFFDFPFCFDFYDDDGVKHDQILGEMLFVDAVIGFQMTVSAYVCAAWGTVCWDSPDYDLLDPPISYAVGGGDVCQAAAAPFSEPPESQPTGADGPSNRGPQASPRIASDSAGNSMTVWIHDGNPGTISPDPDVYFVYKTIGGSWSQMPAPVLNTPLFESDPRITFLAPGNAMLVVAQNQMTQATAESQTHMNDVLVEQELVTFLYTAGVGWVQAPAVTSDTILPIADGRAELTNRQNPEPIVVWVRDPDGSIGLSCNTEVFASRWDQVMQQWDPATQLSSCGSGCCAEADVAFDGTGNAMAVWVHDADGDPTTDDRTIEARYYNAVSGWDPSPFTAVNSLPGVLWPSVAFDGVGRPVVAFTARGEGGLGYPNGDEYGEGTHDFLFSATQAPPNAPNATLPFSHVEPIGGPYQQRGRWPRMVLDGSGPDPTAVVAARWFKGSGSDGYDGEVGLMVKSLPATFDPAGCWSVPTRFSSDSALDWQIDVNADPVANVIRTVWVKPSAASGIFGAGFESLQLIESKLGPDYAVVNPSPSTPFPALGDQVDVQAGVMNEGSSDSGGPPVDVGFYLDGYDPQFPNDNLITLVPLQTNCQKSSKVTAPWPSDGFPHDIVVVVDPFNLLDEDNRANNAASVSILASPAPDGLGGVPNLAEQAVALSWNPPQVANPAAPTAESYKVYRQPSGLGSLALVGTTTGTAYTDRTVTPGDYDYQVTALTPSGAESPPAVLSAITMPNASDVDRDRIPDATDNCSSVFNPLQTDSDNDTFGDACDVCRFEFNPGQGPVAFSQTMAAIDSTNFGWTDPADIVQVRGMLDLVSAYVTDTVQSAAAVQSFEDTELPAVGNAFYYLVKPDCPGGSWQTLLDAEPQRDLDLP